MLDDKLISISAVGKYVPEKILTNKDLEKMVDTNDEWITTRTGIKERHISEKNEPTSALATKAIQNLFEEYNISSDEIDALVIATISPDMFFPSTAAVTLDNLKIKHAFGFDISAACSGFLYALKTGESFIKSGMAKKVLVVGADEMSTITDYTDRNTCVLFGDGAGAVLLEESKTENGIIDTILHTDGSGKDLLYMLGGGSLNPTTHETVDKKMHYIYQDGRPVYKFAVKYMTQVAKDILKKHNFTSSDVSLFIPHQANKRIIEAVGKRLKIDPENVFININKYGNTTAATIPLGIYDAMQEKKLIKYDLLLLGAFGGGFTWGSSLIRWEI